MDPELVDFILADPATALDNYIAIFDEADSFDEFMAVYGSAK